MVENFVNDVFNFIAVFHIFFDVRSSIVYRQIICIFGKSFGPLARCVFLLDLYWLFLQVRAAVHFDYSSLRGLLLDEMLVILHIHILWTSGRDLQVHFFSFHPSERVL